MTNRHGKNLWIKIISLALAIIIWYYVTEELRHATGEERLPFWVSYTQSNVVKEVKIVPVIVGRPAANYVLRSQNITVKPDTTFIMGPKRIVDRIASLRTWQVDVTGQNKTFTLMAPLELVKGVRFYGSGGIVDVTIPIEKAR
jgi:YbbR domain-containing protein